MIQMNYQLNMCACSFPYRLVVLVLLAIVSVSGTWVLAAEEDVAFGEDGSFFGRQGFARGVNSDDSGLLKAMENSSSLTNVRAVRLEGTVSGFSGNMFSLSNVRVLSDTTDLSDYLSMKFLVDVESFRLILQDVRITPDLGIYNSSNDLFSRDVGADIYMGTPEGASLGPDTLHSITADPNDDFPMPLEAGTVLTIRVYHPSDDVEVQIIYPDGRYRLKRVYRQDSNWYTWGMSILESGEYQVRFVSQNDTRVSLDFGFTNGNRTALTRLNSGDEIYASLPGWGYEYAKYELDLNAGDIVSVTDPNDNDIMLTLVNSNSVSLRNVEGELWHKAMFGGTYYLFIINTHYFSGTSYWGHITITPDADIDKYPKFVSVLNQSANEGELFEFELSASNAEGASFRAAGLPEAVSIDEATGVIRGTPQLSGVFPITVTVENAFGMDEADFLLDVQSVSCPSWDLNNDGVVNMVDLGIVSDHWLEENTCSD